MSDKKEYSRRDFAKISAFGALASTPLVGMANSIFNSAHTNSDEPKVFLFSKHLQFLNYRDMSEAAKGMGFTGLDLTVRPKGHVLPEKVADDLPAATEAMKSFGLETLMIASAVDDANDPIDQKVLEVASQQGYEFYRTNWFKYSEDLSIQDSLSKYTNTIKALSELNKRLNISGSYQNHSGPYLGSPIWDLDQALEGISPKLMGSQYDITHACVEGGKAWEVSLRLIMNHINTLAMKDYIWEKVGGKWKVSYVPLGEGMVDFGRFFSLLKKHKINVPISIHVEYDLGGAEHGKTPTMDRKEIFKKISKDLNFLKETWKNTHVD